MTLAFSIGIAVLVGLCIAGVATLLGIDALVTRRRRRFAARDGVASDALMEAVARLDPAGDVDLVDLRSLTALADADIDRVVVGVAGRFAGDSLRATTRIAEHLGVVHRARRRTRSRLWWRRLAGVRALATLATGTDAIERLLADPRPLVRAQTAQWSTSRPTSSMVESLLTLLDDADGRCRFAAKDAIVRIGAPAVPALVAALGDPERGRTRDVLDVALAIGDLAFAPAAASLAASADPSVRARATELVGATAPADATALLLAALDADPDPGVRSVAARALGRRGEWDAAPELGAAMGDADPSVRLAAGRALLRLGAAGEITLRLRAAETDGRAAELARRLLDLGAFHRRVGAA